MFRKFHVLALSNRPLIGASYVDDSKEDRLYGIESFLAIPNDSHPQHVIHLFRRWGLEGSSMKCASTSLFLTCNYLYDDDVQL